MVGANLAFVNGPSNILIERRAVSVSFDYRPGLDTTLSFGAGAGLGGRMTTASARHDIFPGWLVSFAYSRRLLDGSGKGPFLLFSLSGGASGATTQEGVFGSSAPAPASVFLYTFDVRGGLTVGKTFFNVLSPYAAVRAFGGPVFWEQRGKTILGTDRYHFQIGLGVVTSLPRGFDVFVEVAPLGERAVTLGTGRSF